MSEVRRLAPCSHITGRCMRHLWNETARAVCVGFLIVSPRTVPNVSAYIPVYLFQTVIGVWGGYPNISRLSKDLQDGLLIMALGNSPMQD